MARITFTGRVFRVIRTRHAPLPESQLKPIPKTKRFSEFSINSFLLLVSFYFLFIHKDKTPPNKRVDHVKINICEHVVFDGWLRHSDPVYFAVFYTNSDLSVTQSNYLTNWKTYKRWYMPK